MPSQRPRYQTETERYLSRLRDRAMTGRNNGGADARGGNQLEIKLTTNLTLCISVRNASLPISRPIQSLFSPAPMREKLHVKVTCR